MNAIPISEMKDTAGFTRAVEEADGPVTVTRNGYEKLVVMTPEVFEKYRLSAGSSQADSERVGRERAARLDAILSSAEERLASSGLPVPTEDEINAFIAKVRAERASEGIVA